MPKNKNLEVECQRKQKSLITFINQIIPDVLDSLPIECKKVACYYFTA